MRRARALIVLAALLLGPPALLAAEEIREAGFVFVHSAAGKAQLHAEPRPDAKVVGVPPSGMRLVYRKRLDDGGKTLWYLAELPGGSPGWLAAADASTKRPVDVPALKPIKLIDSGIGSSALPVGGMTAAARGLDKRARHYGETEDLKTSADQFVTVERFVDQLFQDKQDADGVYLSEAPSPVRRSSAEEFKAALKREEAR